LGTDAAALSAVSESVSTVATAAVFLSYASEDAGAARRIADAMRGFGVEVWFDQAELRGGDAWDQKIRGQIRTCGLFLPIISGNTQRRHEGYFRREWKLAVERTHDMADGVPFIVPVVIDATAESAALVPEQFLRVQWTRLAGGAPTPEFVAQTKRLLEPQRRTATAITSAASAHSRSFASASKSPLLAVGALAAVALAAAAYFTLRPAAPKTGAMAPTQAPAETKPSAPNLAAGADDKAVAVLPFANLSGDKDQEYFSDGLTEEILNALARERDLHVPGRASTFSFKGKNAAPAEMARALNVSRLVEGSVRKSGSRVRVSVTLTRAADGFSEALGSFDRELADVFALQDEVARAVVEKITHRAATRPAAALTKNAEAYDAYLRGRALQTRAASNSPEAAKLFERALTLDPSFALAAVRLAEATFRPYGTRTDRSPALVTATPAAIDRALSAQPDLPEALIMRANWVRYVENDFAAARRDLDRAESLQAPTAELRHAQALLARDSDNWPEYARRVQEMLQLDPQNGDYTEGHVHGLYEPRGDYAEADRLTLRAMTIQGPGIASPFRGRISLRRDWRGPEAALRLVDRAPAGQVGLKLIRAETLVSLGRLDEARALVDELERGTEERAGPATGISLLRALGLDELARRRAGEVRTAALQEFQRGNRAPAVCQNLVLAETTLGHLDAALVTLEQWRKETQRLPSASRRDLDFCQRAFGLYAQLGKVDEEIALIRDHLAGGYHLGYGLRYTLEFAPIRSDSRVQELMKQEESWARTLPDPVDP